MREQEIYIEAISHEDPDDRCRLLDQACEGDRALRERLDKLLEHRNEIGSFLENTQSTLFENERLTQIGPYKIRETIGEGGMGVVYVAEQTEPVQRKVAIKVIKPGMDTKEVIARFEAERQALAFMEHPNIARVLDAGATETGRSFFVMELVRGIPITEYCDQVKLSLRERLELFATVCDAVQHAHQKGIIHRDIKPSNVLVTQVSAKPVVKVIDFGLAKATSGQRLTDKTVYTGFMRLMGTPIYMSPEQAGLSGLDVDTRSDIYSLGVLLYELLTGTTPLDKTDVQKKAYEELCRQIREVDAPKPSARISTLKDAARSTIAQQRHVDPKSLRQFLHGDLDRVVMKALEKDRDRRYETPKDLAADIDRFLDNKPVQAVPPSALYHARKYMRRHKVAIVTAATIITMLIVATTFSSWQAMRATKAVTAADTARKAALLAKQDALEQKGRADAEAKKAIESERRARGFQYGSDMNLAQQALLNLNDLGKARRLLNRHRPQPGEEDLRGWEWRYVWQLTRSQSLATLARRRVGGHSISFSPGGTRLAVGWTDGRVDLWDVPGRRLDRTIVDPGPAGGRVAFSPVDNLLAVTSEPNVVTLYDLDSGQESIAWTPPNEGRWNLNSFIFSKDGSKLIVGARAIKTGDIPEAEVWLVDLSSSDSESRRMEGEAACLAPDNQRMYVGRLDLSRARLGQGSSLYGYIHCIQLSTGEELWRTQIRRAIGLSSLDISPDGMLLVSGSAHEDGAIYVWDAQTGELVERLPGHTGWAGGVFSEDGQRLVSASADQTIRIWDTGTWRQTQLLRGHTSAISGLAVSDEQRLIASVGGDGQLMLWKENGHDAANRYTRLAAETLDNDVRVLGNARLLSLSPDPNKPPQLVDLTNNSPEVPLPEIGSSANVPKWGMWDMDVICHWDGNNQILVHDVRGDKLIQRGAVTLHSAQRPTNRLTYNVKRQLVAWTEETSPKSVFVDSPSEPGRRTELKSDVPNIFLWRFSESGRFLTGGTQDQACMRAWNIETGQIVASTNDQKGWDLHFAMGGRVLVVSLERGRDHEIVFFDLENPDQPARRVSGLGHSRMLDVSPDGRLAACGTSGGEVRIFDAAEGKLVKSIHGHLTQVYGVAFSPDGKRLISTASGREAVKVWDLSTGQELLTLSGDGSYLYMARWMADGNVILTGAPYQVWRAPSWEDIATIEEAEVKEQ